LIAHNRREAPIALDGVAHVRRFPIERSCSLHLTIAVIAEETFRLRSPTHGRRNRAALPGQQALAVWNHRQIAGYHSSVA
jgi:hypothetical protein